MKTLILFLTLFIICISTFTLAQPKIQFDTTIYDFGSVVESNESFKAKFWFTNIGTEPLVIGRVQTSGGGLASGGWPKEPVLPGKRDFIILQYYGRRIGPINKTATVTTNALNDNGTIILRVKGEVLLKKTSIKVDKDEGYIGTIPFGEVDTISFIVTNIGNEPLHFNFLRSYPDPVIDLFYIRLSPHSFINSNKLLLEKQNYGEIVAEPNEMIQVQICLRNNHGNIGQLERYLYFKYNSHDTLKYTVKTNYIGQPLKSTIYEQNCLYEYKEGRLKRRTSYNMNGTIRQIDNFQDGHLIHSIMYDIPYNGDETECLYKNDLIMERKTTKNIDKQE